MIGSLVRKMIPVATLAAVFVCGAARAASAESFISPFLGYNFGGDAGCPEISNCENKSLNWGVAFGSIGSVFGTEAEISYAPNFFGEIPGTSSNVFTFMGNVMLAPKFGVLQPYGVIGLGLIKTHTEVSLGGLLEADNNKFGWDIGGGAIGYFGRHVGIRGDIRYFHAFQDLEILGIPIADAKLDFGRASAGVLFRF